MLARKAHPAGLPVVHPVHHGSRVAPSKVKRGGLKPKKNAAYVEGKNGADGHNVAAVFASHDIKHAASFAALQPKEKGHVYSSMKTGKWHTEPYKDYVDSQYSRNKLKPNKVTQVQVAARGGKRKLGHSWGMQSGSLPNHATSQHARVPNKGRAVNKHPNAQNR